MTSPRIGLVLGGGGARGFGHIPVIEALDELGLQPAAIAGTSIGAIMGAARAGGLTGAEIRARTLEALDNRSSVLSKLWELRPRKLADLVSRGGMPLGQLDAERVLDVFLGESIPPTFADLVIPLTVVATDFYGWHQADLRTGNLRAAVAASIALPMIFRPVLIGGRVMIDGGVTNPVPVDVLPAEIDLIIAVDVNAFPEPVDGKVLPSATEAIIGATQLLMHGIVAGKLALRPPDMLLRPPLKGFRVLEFLKAAQILEAAEPIKDEVKRRLERLIESQPAEIAALAPPTAEPQSLIGLRKRLIGRGRKKID